MMKTEKSPGMVIKGAGGGGGKGGGGSARVAKEAPDSLRSKAFVRIIDLICEGEIEGLVTGDLQSVYLDRTPVQNADGTFNFTGVTAAFRNGTQNQTYIPGFEAVEDERIIGLEVKNDSPVVHTISDLTTDELRVTIGIPQLSSQNKTNGDISGTSVQIAIDVQPLGGSYTEVTNDTIRGKTTTRYQRSYRIALDGQGPWNVRMRRITADSTTVSLANKTFWDSFTEIVNAKLAYPNSAIVASVMDSEQFSNIPNRGYDMKLLRTRIPSNATVNEDGSLSYSGSWDGTFQIAWHANPAWAFYDMITANRYGIGDYISADQIDKWELYSIGQYCDEQVPDGFGGFEARFRCNIYFQKQSEAFKVLQDLASVFRGMIYWSSGLIVPTQDSPADPVALYTKANVVDGKFKRSGTGLDTRHSVALVTWNDPEDFFTQKVEYVEDIEAIERYGIKETQVVGVGCTSQAQAHRVGKWLLYSEANDTELVSFTVGMDSLYARPGQVIAVQDADRASTRHSGRVMAATTTAVTIDAAFVPDVGANYDLLVMLPSGVVGQVPVSNIDGAVLNLSEALAEAPLAGAVWMVTSNILAVEKFRLVGATDLNDGTFEMTALVYNELKYAAVEQDIKLEAIPTSLVNTPPDPVTGIEAYDVLYERTGGVGVLVTINWSAPARAVSYIFSYQRENGAVLTFDNINAAQFEIENALEGEYLFSVVAVSAIGKRSVVATKKYTVIGKTAIPADVENFSLASISDGVAHLTLDRSIDLDVLIGGSLRVRWTPTLSGATWSNAVDIGPSLPGTTTNFPIPHVTGTFLAKWVDSSGNQSDNAAAVTTNIAQLLNSEQVTVLTEEPDFDGAKTNVFYDNTLGGITLTGSVFIDDITDNIDDIDSLDYYGGLVSVGEYEFPDIIDFGAAYPCRLRASITASSFDAFELIDSNTDLIDDWSDIDGVNVDDTNAQLFLSTTNDDPNGTPTWSEYKPFFVAQENTRGLRFKLALTSASPTHNIVVTGLSLTADIPDRTETVRGIDSGAAAKNITYQNAFYGQPGVGITANNLQSGDRYEITNETDSGFTIEFFNSAGTSVDRNFTYLAKGQGLRS